MKKLSLLLVLITCAMAVQAQRVYFIYLQSDNGSPFFVKMGEKVQSSAASGYIILPNLVDSTYTFTVGFPGKTSETKFAVAINKEDKGYLLKTFEGGLGLFDLQSLKITKAVAATKEPAAIDATIIAAADPFTRLLAQASDDPNIYLSGPNPAAPKEQTIIAREEPKPEPKVEPAVNTSLPASANTSLAVVAITKEEPKPMVDTVAIEPVKLEEKTVVTPPSEIIPEPVVEVYQRSVVTRRSESSTTEGFGLVFLDDQSGAVDTIRLLIPNPKVVAKLVEPEKAEVVGNVSIEPKASKDDTNDKQQVIKSQLDAVPAVDIQKAFEDNANPVAASEKAACPERATDKEFLKLRKNMAAAEDEPEMLSVARKDFAKKCYTTEQVRNLGALFLTSVGKYNFFEAAFTHVFDADQFAQLESEFKDEAYSKRFKTLIRK